MGAPGSRVSIFQCSTCVSKRGRLHSSSPCSLQPCSLWPARVSAAQLATVLVVKVPGLGSLQPCTRSLTPVVAAASSPSEPGVSLPLGNHILRRGAPRLWLPPAVLVSVVHARSSTLLPGSCFLLFDHVLLLRQRLSGSEMARTHQSRGPQPPALPAWWAWVTALWGWPWGAFQATSRVGVGSEVLGCAESPEQEGGPEMSRGQRSRQG